MGSDVMDLEKLFALSHIWIILNFARTTEELIAEATPPGTDWSNGMTSTIADIRSLPTHADA